MTVQPFEPAVVRYHTAARRQPQLIGKDPSGMPIWGGPYTLIQAGGLLLAPMLWGTRDWWAAGMSGLAVIAVIALATAGSVWGLGRVNFAGRNIIYAAAAASAAWRTALTGALHRPARTPGTQISGDVHIGRSTSRPATIGPAGAHQTMAPPDPDPAPTVTADLSTATAPSAQPAGPVQPDFVAVLGVTDDQPGLPAGPIQPTSAAQPGSAVRYRRTASPTSAPIPLPPPASHSAERPPLTRPLAPRPAQPEPQRTPFASGLFGSSPEPKRKSTSDRQRVAGHRKTDRPTPRLDRTVAWSDRPTLHPPTNGPAASPPDCSPTFTADNTRTDAAPDGNPPQRLSPLESFLAAAGKVS